MKKIIVISSAIIMAIFVAITVSGLFESRNIGDYDAHDYDSVKITFSALNSRFRVSCTDTTLIQRFFALAKNCQRIEPRKREVNANYQMEFYGKDEPVFSIGLTTDNQIILGDLTFNLTLMGKSYEADTLRTFVEDLKKLKMERVPRR